MTDVPNCRSGLPCSSLLLVLGSGLTLLGSFGLLRLRTFYERIHAPTLGITWGAAGIRHRVHDSFHDVQSRPIVHEILIGIFVTVTTPVTLMLLGRAALYRDRAEGSPDVPSTNPPIGALGPSEPHDRGQ